MKQAPSPRSVKVSGARAQAVAPLWIVLLGLPTALRKAPLWQLVQLPVTAKLACTRPLAQELKLPL